MKKTPLGRPLGRTYCKRHKHSLSAQLTPNFIESCKNAINFMYSGQIDCISSFSVIYLHHTLDSWRGETA